jgi:hypothetical protein
LATISKVRRLVNPGHRRKLSPLQKLFFGSKRQRAAVRARRSNAGRNSFRKFKKRMKAVGYTPVKNKKFTRFGTRKHRNVGSIVTVWPLGHMNPGRIRKSGRKSVRIIINKGAKRMARRRRNPWPFTRTKRRGRRKSYRVRARRAYGRAKKYVTRTYRKAARRLGVVHHRRRRSNPGRRRYYRRNPGMLSGTAGRVVGVVGGVAATKLLMGFVPAQFSTGIIGYLVAGGVAYAQGMAVGKVSKNTQLGNDFMIGGFAYVVSKILNDFFPTFGAYGGISGMGLIGGSSFYTPQVNLPGSMGSFVVPSAVMGAFPAPANAGVGRLRRTGRLM